MWLGSSVYKPMMDKVHEDLVLVGGLRRKMADERFPNHHTSMAKCTDAAIDAVCLYFVGVWTEERT